MKRTAIKRRGKRTKKSKGHLFPKLVDETYRKWIRTQPCPFRGPEHACFGPVQVCHVKTRGSGGPDHNNVIPGCAGINDQMLRLGVKGFEELWKVRLINLAQSFQQRYADNFLS